MKKHVPADLPTLRYPCVRFASLWPFDAFNGPDDKFARNKDYPNFEFTYFDGLLARLRKEIPDPEARFDAYRTLDVKGVIDPKRLHTFEEKRLLAMDEKFRRAWGPTFWRISAGSGSSTPAHPNGAILSMLMKYLAKELGGCGSSSGFPARWIRSAASRSPCIRRWRRARRALGGSGCALSGAR